MATAPRVQVRPGEYFEASWGYDQTNVDYLVVVRVSPTGKTAVCRMVSHINLGENGTSDVIMPGTAEGPEFQMQVKATYSGEKPVLVGSYPFIWGQWDDKRLGRFYQVALGKVSYQTMAQFGH